MRYLSHSARPSRRHDGQASACKTAKDTHGLISAPEKHGGRECQELVSASPRTIMRTTSPGAFGVYKRKPTMTGNLSLSTTDRRITPKTWFVHSGIRVSTSTETMKTSAWFATGIAACPLPTVNT